MSATYYITQLTAAFLGLISVGIGFKAAYIIFIDLINGEDFSTILLKIKKKVFVLIWALCASGLIIKIQSYFQ